MKTHTRWPRIGPGQHKMLQAIADTDAGLSTDDVTALGLFADLRQNARALDSLLAHGLLAYMVKLQVWRITRPGRDLLAHLKVPAAPYVGVIAPPRQVMFSEDHYMGEDLRPQQARPAGNNHTTIPSLIGGQRVLRRVG